MRYTRNIQRRLLKDNARIDIATGYGRLGKNVRIGNVPKWMHSLDYTFKWHREEGCITFSEDIFGRTFTTKVSVHKREPMKLF